MPSRWMVCLLVLLGAPGCGAVSRQVDRLSLSRLASFATRSPSSGTGSGQALPFSSRDELERLTRPTSLPEVSVTPETSLLIPDERLTQETLVFPSAVRLRHRESDRAVAHLYRRGPLGERPLVV